MRAAAPDSRRGHLIPVPFGREFFRRYHYGKGLSCDAMVCAFAARLAKMSWAMLRDGTHYDARRAFRAYLPTQLPA